eukprot:TRINITY_DN3493_c0_g1_i4.p1 TRINITY_DN3493_c0_g1~~TRINITY_DN3493_c0_g1_i4.p1  ORF type:complete len:208 (+),score=42.25 TRINITY_DN3493_c0_g1_i4:170-793(+)
MCIRDRYQRRVHGNLRKMGNCSEPLPIQIKDEFTFSPNVLKSTTDDVKIKLNTISTACPLVKIDLKLQLVPPKNSRKDENSKWLNEIQPERELFDSTPTEVQPEEEDEDIIPDELEFWTFQKNIKQLRTLSLKQYLPKEIPLRKEKGNKSTFVYGTSRKSRGQSSCSVKLTRLKLFEAITQESKIPFNSSKMVTQLFTLVQALFHGA